MIGRPAIKLSIDVRLTPEILRALSGIMDATRCRNDLHVRIEIGALEALAEIQNMADAARRDLGLG